MSTHDGNCEGIHCKCFARKLRTVQFGNVEAPSERLMEQRLDRDLPAYRRLRNQGLQPKMTRGCAELEQRANTQFEIDHHKLVASDLWRKAGPAVEDITTMVREGMAQARDAEYTLDDVKRWKEAK